MTIELGGFTIQVGGISLWLWAVLLVLQNAAFTWVSRARNSGSIGYHAIASVFSNGIFFVCNFYLILNVAWAQKAASLVQLGLIYVAATVTGSVLMHFVSMKWLEKGKRKVGS